MSIPDFLGAFYFYKTEALTGRDGREYDIERQEVGNLLLPTGKIVACDGLIPDLEPSVQQVAPGTYLVILSMAILDCSYWIACAMLRFSDTMPEAWKPAVTTKQNSQRGYGVDTGAGCFADLAAMKILSADGKNTNNLKRKCTSPILSGLISVQTTHATSLCLLQGVVMEDTPPTLAVMRTKTLFASQQTSASLLRCLTNRPKNRTSSN